LVVVAGTGVAVAVGGTGVLVAVGGTGVGVAVGGTDVLVAVGGSGVFVGGTGVAVGGTGVAVGDSGVAVAGGGVGVWPQPASRDKATHRQRDSRSFFIIDSLLGRAAETRWWQHGSAARRHEIGPHLVGIERPRDDGA